MKMRIVWFLMTLHVAITAVAAPALVSIATTATSRPDKRLKAFIEECENLVLSTTQQALKVTTLVYRNLTRALPPLLQHAILPITSDYQRAVGEALKCPHNYSEQKKLLHYFRYNNIQIERLRIQLQPQLPKFEFHLISRDFYHSGKNVTDFDNLYMKFMLEFQRLSQTLRQDIPEELGEQQEDLLEILDEIAREKELGEKDKLYDEFIEMFLFKPEVDAIKNRQLE